MSTLITFQYKVFLTVVECGSFTKAGEKLGLTQSGVSHNIAKLESELGIVLLRRNRNGLLLTDAGERVMPHIRQIMHQAALLEQEAALIQGMEVGSIKIGTFPSFLQMSFHALFIFLRKAIRISSWSYMKAVMRRLRNGLLQARLMLVF